MSFADDLRKMSNEFELKDRREHDYRYKISEIVKNYTPAILDYCKNMAKSGKKSVRGYLSLSSNSEYGISYYANLAEIDPKIFNKKPAPKATLLSSDPYSAIASCAFTFSENERELTKGMVLLKRGFFDALSVHGFRKLSIEIVTTVRYDPVKAVLNQFKYKKNSNLNYHLLYFDIGW